MNLMEKYIKENLILDDMSTIKDDKGVVTLEYFLKSYKTAVIWGRVKFAEERAKMIHDRRLALEAKDRKVYKRIVQAIRDQDKVNMEQAIEMVFTKLGITEQDFKASEVHMKDEKNVRRLHQITSEAQIDKGEGLEEEER